MKKLFLYVIGSLIILPVYSQHLIKGTIIDSENAVMPMVNVAFLNQADSTLVAGAVSDSYNSGIRLRSEFQPPQQRAAAGGD